MNQNLQNNTNNNNSNNTDNNSNILQEIIIPAIVIIEFKGHRRAAFLNENQLNINKNDKVVVQLDSGIDLGTVTFAKPCDCEKICNKSIKDITNSVLRLATSDDLDNEFTNRYDEPFIVSKTNEFAQNYGIDMKIVDAEWQLDRQKLTVFFTSPGRVDFRELVKELAKQFKTRIELRQINPREETRRIGAGIGCCGETICCTSFLFDFNQVTIEHAKIQQLSNNVTKLSGNCGRLKCCLLFEYEHYAAELEKYPPLNSRFSMEEGEAILTKIDIFKHTVTLYNYQQKKNITLEHKELEVYIKANKVAAPIVSEEDKLIQFADEDIILE